MTTLEPFVPGLLPTTGEQRPKRGPRKAKAEKPAKAKRGRKPREQKFTTPPEPLDWDKSDAIIAKILSWWDVLIQLDAEGRKQVLKKILA